MKTVIKKLYIHHIFVSTTKWIRKVEIYNKNIFNFLINYLMPYYNLLVSLS